MTSTALVEHLKSKGKALLIIDGIARQKRHEISTTKTWVEQVIAQAGQFDPKFTELYFNGKKISNDDFLFDAYPKDGDALVIKTRPQGLEGLALYAVIAAVAVAASVAVMMLMTKKPLTSGTGKQSPNSSFAGQTNSARLYEQRPDIYGIVRAYPDIISEAVEEYNSNNRKVLTHYLNVGLGYYELTKPRYSDSNVANFANSEYTFYQAGETIPLIYEQYSFSEIDSAGQELLGPNEIAYVSGDPYYTATPVSTTSSVTLQTFTVVYSNPTAGVPPLSGGGGQLGAWWLARDTLTNQLSGVAIKYTYNREVRKQTGVDGSGNPIYTYVSTATEYTSQTNTITYDSITDRFTVTATSFTGLHTDRYYVGAVGMYQIESTYAGWYTSNVSGTELWFNFVFQQGLKGTANIAIEYSTCDSDGVPIGSTVTANISYSKSTFDDWSFTHKITGLTDSYYRVRLKRTNNSSTDASKPDMVKVEKISAMIKRVNVVHAGDTIWTIKTTANNQSAGTEMKFNAMASRKMIWWDGTTVRGWNATTKTEIPDDMRASQFCADAILHNWIVMGGNTVNGIDVEGLYEIHDALYAQNPELVRCSVTFDDKDQTLGDRINAIANLMRCETSFDGDKYYFVRDEPRSVVVAQFDGNNIASDGFSHTHSFLVADQVTGIKLQWVDVEEKNKKRYIYLTLDANGNIVEGKSAHPNEIEFTGCCNSTQAYDRAYYEMRKLIYRNMTVQFDTFNEGFIPLHGDLVRYVDYANEYMFNGEIMSITVNNDGSVTYSTSAVIELEDGVTYSAICNNSSGAASTDGWETVTEWTRNSFTVATALNGAFISNGNDIRVGSRYIISRLTEKSANLFLVTKKEPNSDGTINIELQNYDERVYG